MKANQGTATHQVVIRKLLIYLFPDWEHYHCQEGDNVNGRIRLLTIQKLLLKNGKTTVKEIQAEIFNLYNEKAERKAIYKDIRALQQFYHINKKKVNDMVVYILERKNNE